MALIRNTFVANMDNNATRMMDMKCKAAFQYSPRCVENFPFVRRLSLTRRSLTRQNSNESTTNSCSIDITHDNNDNSTTSSRGVSFSTVQIRTYSVEYGFYPDKSCPISLGPKLLNETTVTVDDYEKRCNEGRVRTFLAELRQKFRETPETGSTGKAFRLSETERRQRLKRWGYSNMKLTKLDTERKELNESMKVPLREGLPIY